MQNITIQKQYLQYNVIQLKYHTIAV